MLGALVILLTLCNPNIAGAGFISLFSLLLFILILQLDIEDISSSHYFFNPVLVGMSIGAIFELSPTLVIIICISTIMTFLLTLILAKLFNSCGIPVLSLPFAIVSTGIYLAAAGYHKLFSLALYDNRIFSGLEAYLPDIAACFLKALGTIIFMPNVLAGLVIFAIILYTSRILAIHAIIAFIAGVYIHFLMSASWTDSLADPYSFNYILVGLALGGTFILPSLRSSFICLLAVGVSAIFIDITAGCAETFNIPVFTLPFNCTVILFVSALRIIKYPEYNYDIRSSPELSLSTSLAFKKRFKPEEASILPPLREACTVYQGNAGESTHKGKWRYAYDLIISRDGSMHAGDGTRLEDYYVFDREIISPVSGYVVNCSDFLPDNRPGIVDHTNNWGNYLIIRDLNGNHIEISHLKQHSLQVKLNAYVEAGQHIANCGNSGYSPFPHVHIQAQKSALLGDETVPMNFAVYLSGGEVKLQEQPKKDECVEAVKYSDELYENFRFTIGGVYEYTVFRNGMKKGRTQFKVKRSRDLSGRLFLEDEKGSRLYFAVMNGSFYIYDYVGESASYLKTLYCAVPRFPLLDMPLFKYREYVPMNIIFSGFSYAFRSLACWLYSKSIPCGEWTYEGDNSLSGILFRGGKQIRTKLVFDKDNGFKIIEAGKIKLVSGGTNEE
jgi:urea transporter